MKMKQKIKINSHDDRTSPKTNADYTVFKTTGGTMSAFETELITKLKDAEKQDVEIGVNVEKSADGKFLNIRGIADDESNMEGTINGVDPKTFLRQSVKNSAYEKDPVGLAVEIFNANAETSMNESIEFVRQAQKAFS